MTTTEYADLCYAHGFPRIGDDPVAAARELHLINLAREHGDAFKDIFNGFYFAVWNTPFFKVVKPRIILDESPEPSPELGPAIRRFSESLQGKPWHPFFKFPSATMANGQTKNTDTDTMNIQVNITADDKILDAINNLASAVSGGWKGNAGDRLEAKLAEREATTPVTDEAETPVTTTAPEPKKKEKKAPVLKAPEPAIEPEPDILANVPTGAELKARVTPLKDTPFLKQLRDYMDGPLGLKGTGLAAVTDVDALKKLEPKINELLAAKEAADDV